MQLRLLAPMTIGLRLRPGAAVRDPKRYAGFWEDCAEELAEAPELRVHLPHACPSTPFNRYQRIDTHSLDRSLEIIDLTIEPSALSDLVAKASDDLASRNAGGTADAAFLWDCVRRVECRVYDHGVALVEVFADLSELLPDGLDPAAVPATLDRLQQAAVDLGAQVTGAVHTTLSDRVVAPLRNVDRRHGEAVLMPPMAGPLAGTEAGHGQPLWVTRSLVLCQGGESGRPVVEHWLKDVPVDRQSGITGKETEGDEMPAERLLVRGEGRVVRWLNYLFIHGGDADPFGERGQFADVWEALRCAQYYYAALEAINARLAAILAQSLAAESAVELGRLRAELQRASGRARMILMELDDVAKYLKRSVRQELDDILDYWGFEELVGKPVQAKIDACDARLRELEAQRSARSSMFTDLILLALGVTSILGTAVGLAEFGRARTSNPSLSIYDVGRSDVVAWFAAQPADAILVVSGITSLVLVVVYLYFRRTHR